jgi:hypothetical protein
MVKGILATIAQRAIEEHIQSPAIIVIGAVVALSDALNWFETLSPHGAGEHAILSTDFGDSQEVFRRKVPEVIK